MYKKILYRASMMSGGKPVPKISIVRAQKISGHVFYDSSGKIRFLRGKIDNHFFSFAEAREFLWTKAEEYMTKKLEEFREAQATLNEIISMEEINGTKTYAGTQKD